MKIFICHRLCRRSWRGMLSGYGVAMSSKGSGEAASPKSTTTDRLRCVFSQPETLFLFLTFCRWVRSTCHRCSSCSLAHYATNSYLPSSRQGLFMTMLSIGLLLQICQRTDGLHLELVTSSANSTGSLPRFQLHIETRTTEVLALVRPMS